MTAIAWNRFLNEASDLPAPQCAAIETRTKELGEQLFTRSDQYAARWFQRRWWDERVMRLAMRDDALKVQLFRFVDVLPMLNSSQAIVAHLHEYLDPVRARLPQSLRWGLSLSRRWRFLSGVVGQTACWGAMDLARRFIAGTNTAEVLAAAQQQREAGRAFTLDILGEAVTSDLEANQFFRGYVELLERLAPEVQRWSESPQVDQSAWGRLPRLNLSIKLSALDCRFDAIDPTGALERVGGRLRELLRLARRCRAFINVDMESYAKKDLTLWIFQQVLQEDEFRDFSDVGIVVQCYLVDAPRDLQALRLWAERRGAPIWVRLVKGAYWDYETIHARATGWPIPVYQEKWQSDACFEWATRYVLRHHQQLRPAIGSHNLRSIAHALATAELLELPKDAVELQMLYGMADNEKRALASLGRRVRVYMPYGELIPGMAYLVRRLLENTSNESFLRAETLQQQARSKRLKNPLDGLHLAAMQPTTVQATAMQATTVQSTRLQPESPMSSRAQASSFSVPWTNQPPIDFAQASEREAMQTALDTVLGRLGNRYGLVIGQETIMPPRMQRSLDPSYQDRVVGEFALAEPSHVEEAVAAARAAQPAWEAIGAEARAALLCKVAQNLRERRFELAAWEVYECGKGWREATADLAEAIDFCEYYAAGACALTQPTGADVPGEENRFSYRARGVAAVIAPWNFPLAILTGMTTAALATGNTVIMKPAEQASVCAAQLMRVFQASGLPPGVVNYLPGTGETVGAALVEHPDVDLIAFTGSLAVGLQVNAQAAIASARHRRSVKRVIAEMGGKNAIIVDADADLDEAVLGVLQSAFGYQGQKCSACSRAIVLDAVHDAFLQRLVEAARSLRIGPAQAPSTDVGPVIDRAAQAKIQQYVAIGRAEGKVELAMEPSPELAQLGCYVGPHIFSRIEPQSRLAQEEVFGPVLAVMRARDLDDAIRLANGTDFALTGGVYSRSPATLERVKREMQVGNLYLNRPITGALVGRQPFGGYKLSGIGSKAGGPDYLVQYVIPMTITENTMRRGFAPS